MALTKCLTLKCWHENISLLQQLYVCLPSVTADNQEENKYLSACVFGPPSVINIVLHKIKVTAGEDNSDNHFTVQRSETGNPERGERSEKKKKDGQY